MTSSRPLFTCRLVLLLLLYWYAHLSQSFQIDAKPRRAERFEACCQRALLNVQIIPLLFPFTVQKYVYPPVNKVHAWSFRVSVNQPKSDMDYRVFNVRTSIILVRVRVHTGGWAHVPTAMSAQHFDSEKNSHNCFSCLRSWGPMHGPRQRP